MSRGHRVVPLGAALSLAFLLVHPDIERNAAGGPAGVVELGNDSGKAILMNSAYPSVKPSIIYSSIYLIHTYIPDVTICLPMRMSMQTSSAISAPGLRAALITYAVALQDWMAPSV